MNYLQKQAALQKLAETAMAIRYVLRQRHMQKRAGGFASEGAPSVSFWNAYLGRNPYGNKQEQMRKAHSKAQGYDQYEKPHWQFGGTVESKVPRVSFWDALRGRNPYGDQQEQDRIVHSRARGYTQYENGVNNLQTVNPQRPRSFSNALRNGMYRLYQGVKEPLEYWSGNRPDPAKWDPVKSSR